MVTLRVYFEQHRYFLSKNYFANYLGNYLKNWATIWKIALLFILSSGYTGHSSKENVEHFSKMMQWCIGQF